MLSTQLQRTCFFWKWLFYGKYLLVGHTLKEVGRPLHSNFQSKNYLSKNRKNRKGKWTLKFQYQLLAMPVFRSERFALNKMFQQNLSKFAIYILCIRKSFLICSYTSFSWTFCWAQTSDFWRVQQQAITISSKRMRWFNACEESP